MNPIRLAISGSKVLRRAAMLLALLCATVGAASAQTARWAMLGPPGGTVTALLADPLAPAMLVAGSADNGIFVSPDRGATWVTANVGLTPTTNTFRRTVHALATDGNRLFAATDAGLFVSDAGTTPAWSRLADTGSATPMGRLAFDAATSRLLAAAPSGSDGAPTAVYSATLAPGVAVAWQRADLPAATVGIGIDALIVVPAPGQPSQVLAATQAGLYAAAVVAGSPSLAWASADPFATLPGAATALVHSNSFAQTFACVAGAVFYASDVAGSSPVWLQATSEQPAGGGFACRSGYALESTVGGSIGAVMWATDSGVLASLNGTNFVLTSAPGGVPTTYAPLALPATASEPSMALIAGAGGVFTAQPSALASGSAWIASNGPASVDPAVAASRLNNAAVADAALVGSNLYALVDTEAGADIWASDDGGATWRSTGAAAAAPAGASITALQADAANKILFAATTQGLMVHATTTSSSWSLVSPATLDARVRSLALGANALFVGSDAGLYAVPRQALAGSMQAAAGGLAGIRVTALHVAAGKVYAATLDGNDQAQAWVADEAGAAGASATWLPFGVDSVGDRSVLALALVGDRLLAATNGNGLRYASAGSGWASTSGDPANAISDAQGVVTSVVSDGTSIFAATRNNGIFVSPVGAAFFWQPFNGSGDAALASAGVNSLRAFGSRLYAGTSAGIAVYEGLAGAGTATPPTTTPTSPGTTTPAPAPSSGGGGASSALFSLLLCAAALALRQRRSPRH